MAVIVVSGHDENRTDTRVALGSERNTLDSLKVIEGNEVRGVQSG
jgi:hypothetical protein